MIAPEVERTQPPRLADERDLLEGWLDFHRATLLHKCAGLTDAQLRQAACPPSNLTLLGLVRHMAEVERDWFRHLFAGEALEELYCRDSAPDAEFEEVATADAEADLATFRQEVELARQATSGRSLADTFRLPERGTEMDLRWVYVHLIEEYARHNGHADLLREAIDGTTGT